MDMDRKAIKLSKCQHIFLLIKAIQHATGQHTTLSPLPRKEGSGQPSVHNFFSASRSPSYDQFFKMTLYFFRPERPAKSVNTSFLCLSRWILKLAMARNDLFYIHRRLDTESTLTIQPGERFYIFLVHREKQHFV